MVLKQIEKPTFIFPVRNTKYIVVAGSYFWNSMQTILVDSFLPIPSVFLLIFLSFLLLVGKWKHFPLCSEDQDIIKHRYFVLHWIGKHMTARGTAPPLSVRNINPVILEKMVKELNQSSGGHSHLTKSLRVYLTACQNWRNSKTMLSRLLRSIVKVLIAIICEGFAHICCLQLPF